MNVTAGGVDPVVDPRPGSDLNPLWGPDWPEVRRHWMLDPAVTFLNHGSFGACPRPVLAAQARWRDEMERQPVEFLWRRLPDLLDEARLAVAEFLRADPDDLVFVRNATVGVGTVLAATELRSAERILVTNHTYPAVLNAASRAAREGGGHLDVVPIPLPLPDPEEIVDRIEAAITPRTRLAIVDHVTSPTGAILPIERIVAACRERRTPILVDGAHAPGMLPLDLRTLGADYWTGNFHKWVCAPKGSAALVVSPERRGLLPIVTSHDIEGTYHRRFDWLGTDDPTPWLATPAAIGFMAGLGWDRVRRHNHELAVLGRALGSAATGVHPPVPVEATGSVSLVGLPESTGGTKEDGERIHDRLYDRARIEVPLSAWDGRLFARLSAQVYNRPTDYERLAEVLPEILGESRPTWSAGGPDRLSR